MGISETVIDAAISQFVKQYLDPQGPFVTPKFGAGTYHSVLSTNRIVLEPVNNGASFQGSIIVRKDFRNLITIRGTMVAAVVGASIYTTRLISFVRPVVTPLKYLSFPGVWSNTTGVGPQRHRVSDEYAAYNLETGKFDVGYAWMNALRFQATTPSISSVIELAAHDGSGFNQGGGDYTVQAFTDIGESFAMSAVVTNAAVPSGTTAVSSTFASSPIGTWTGVFFKPTDEVEISSAIINTTTNQGVTTIGVSEIDIPIDRSPSFDALEQASTFYCIETVTANFGWAGNKAASSGSVSCATIQYGQPTPDDPDALGDYISKLPPSVRYMSSSGEDKSENIEHGARSVVTGSRLRDFESIPIAENYNAPAAVFAWKVPPAGSAQPPQAILTVKTVISFMTADLVYGPIKAPPGWDLVQQWADFQCQHNLNTSNEGHWQKYKSIVSSAIRDPRMRQAAKMALKVAKTVGPMVAPRTSSLWEMLP